MKEDGRESKGPENPPALRIPSIFDRSRGKSVAEYDGEKWSVLGLVVITTALREKCSIITAWHLMRMEFQSFTCSIHARTSSGRFRIWSMMRKMWEDIDTTQEDHIYDECRYVFMQHPIPMRRSVKKEIPLEDPLDLFAEERKKAHRIIRI